MTPVVSDDEQMRMRSDFLFGLNNTAMYAATRGSPLFLPSHISFLMAYVDGWLRSESGPDNEKEKAVMKALFRHSPKWAKHLTLRLLKARWIPERAQRLLLLTPLLIPLVVTLPWQFIWSGAKSAWDILGNGIRSVPPLVTAVVVVFVTSDAWRILGTGFTPRFFILASAFLLASLLFLIRRNWWADVDAAEDDVERRLLEGIKHWNTGSLRDFMDRGAKPVPMEKPRGLRKVYAYLTYIGLIAFALIATALFVSIILTIVGLILINANETKNLAGSVDAYHPLSGIMVTKQLLSLSLSLGAFAAFFLVAAQRSAERDDFIRNILARYRRALLVYTTYCHARDSAKEWTGISVELKLRKQDMLEPNLQEEGVAIPAARVIA